MSEIKELWVDTGPVFGTFKARVLKREDWEKDPEWEKKIERAKNDLEKQLKARAGLKFRIFALPP